MKKKTLHILFVSFSALLMLLPGCIRESMDSGTVGGVAIPFSMSVGQVTMPETKMEGSITQVGNNSFRGIDCVYVIPFKVNGTSVGDDKEPSSSNPILPLNGLPSDGLISGSNAYLYSRAYFELGTNAVLIYGKAPDVSQMTDTEVSFKQRNGILLHPDLNDVQTSGDIHFSLEQASPGNTLTNLLGSYINFINTITGASWKSYSFNDPASYNNHPTLKRAFEDFTSEGIYFQMSTEVLNYKLTQLYRAVYPLTNADSAEHIGYNKDGYKYVCELAKVIIKKFGSKQTEGTEDNNNIYRQGVGKNAVISIKVQKELQNLPVSYGLPYGMHAAQWKEGTKSFALLKNISEGKVGNDVIHYVGLALAPQDDICFPPALWYYANSPLRTSDDASVTEGYASAGDWDSIVALYPDGSVKSDSEAAAVYDQLQYGVALLQLSCKKTASSLPQSVGGNVGMNNYNFPLTGIIVCDQYDQTYEFHPKDGAAKRYVYDASVSGAYLTSKSDYTAPAQSTLVLQTRANDRVHFALEFQNNSSNTVYGLNGCKLFPGCHFYLAGVLDIDKLPDGSNPNNIDRVFIGDCYTSVNVSVTSLAYALNVLPDLSDPQLQIGVKAEFGWHLSTPVSKRIEVR